MELVKAKRPTLAGEFAVIEKLVDTNDECATWTHPEHTELTSATFAKVLLVMYGALRAQGKLAAFFRDNDVTNGERMFFFAVGTCLDSAIDTAERPKAETQPYEPDPRD